MLKVIALGNSLRGDDGIGPAVLEMLQKEPDLPSMQLIDAGTDALEILDHLMQPQKILIIDCARMGNVPGTVRQFDLEQATLALAGKNISLHGFSLAEIVRMAELMGRRAECSIIGVEPFDICFNHGLSEPVSASMHRIKDLIIKEAEAYA